MSPSDTTFLSTLAAEVERSRENLHLDNYDVGQLGPYRGEKHREDLVGPKSERAGDAAPHELATRLSQFADVGFLHGILADQESRDLLIKLFAYRTLGYRKVKLPRNTEQYWDDIQAVRGAATTSPPIPISYMDMRLARHDMHRFAYDLQIYGTAAGIACTYVQKQYEYHRGGVVCKAEPGDVAIDAGACWGETTVYLAHEVGAQGRVLSFEFIPTNLAVLRRNLEANLPLAGRVDVVENPLWSTSGHALYYVDWGPGSRVSPDPSRYPARRALLDGVDRRRGQHAPGPARRLHQDGRRRRGAARAQGRRANAARAPPQAGDQPLSPAQRLRDHPALPRIARASVTRTTSTTTRSTSTKRCCSPWRR